MECVKDINLNFKFQHFRAARERTTYFIPSVSIFRLNNRLVNGTGLKTSEREGHGMRQWFIGWTR